MTHHRIPPFYKHHDRPSRRSRFNQIGVTRHQLNYSRSSMGNTVEWLKPDFPFFSRFNLSRRPRDNKTAIEPFQRFCDGIEDFGLELRNLLKAS